MVSLERLVHELGHDLRALGHWLWTDVDAVWLIVAVLLILMALRTARLPDRWVSRLPASEWVDDHEVEPTEMEDSSPRSKPNVDRAVTPRC
jgi:hypothetical protein